MKLRTFTIIAVFAALLLSGTLMAASGHAVLHGSAPAWANSRNFTGGTDPNGSVGFRVYLGWKNAAAAETFALAVSDPTSAQYRQYVTPQQFRNQFAPSQADVKAVQSWLKSQGFAVNYTPGNNHYVSAEGTVAQAQAAFGVQFAMYNVRGQAVRSPAGDVSIPSSLASIVAGVVGLDNSAIFVHTDHIRDAPPSAGFRNAPPLSTYWAEFVSPCGLHCDFKPSHRTLDSEGLYACSNQGCLRHLLGVRWCGSNRRHNRRLCVSYHSPGRKPVVDQSRLADDELLPIGSGRAARCVQATGESKPRSARLVWRRDVGR